MYFERFLLAVILKKIVSFQKEPNRKLGQLDGPTKYDLEKVRRMYNC